MPIAFLLLSCREASQKLHSERSQHLSKVASIKQNAVSGFRFIFLLCSPIFSPHSTIVLYSLSFLSGCWRHPQCHSSRFGQEAGYLGEILPSSLLFCSPQFCYAKECMFSFMMCSTDLLPYLFLLLTCYCCYFCGILGQPYFYTSYAPPFCGKIWWFCPFHPPMPNMLLYASKLLESSTFLALKLHPNLQLHV